jgi:hypothetical protein
LPLGTAGGAIISAMTHGAETSQDDKGEAEGFDLGLLWLWPILLLHAVFETFAGHARKLKAMRKRPMPKEWGQAIPGLLQCEWHIRSMTASGVAILLSGRELNLGEVDHEWAPPADLEIPHPKSAWETHRRMEAIARFHADPEAFIRRQAQRVARAQARLARGLDSTTIFPCDAADPTTTIFAASRASGDLHPDSRIRAPPWLDLAPPQPAHPTRKASLREREIMPKNKKGPPTQISGPLSYAGGPTSPPLARAPCRPAAATRRAG